MSNIQNLIEELKVEKSKANEKANQFIEGKVDRIRFQNEGMVHAFDFCIQKLTLLLLNEPKAITETALSQTLMLGDSAANVERLNIGEVPAVSSETGSVRQNEQTKEFCPTCNGIQFYRNRTGNLYCPICFKW